MSTAIRCDYCGDIIPPDSSSWNAVHSGVKVEVTKATYLARSESFADFCRGDCWEAFVKGVALVISAGPAIEHIPVAADRKPATSAGPSEPEGKPSLVSDLIEVGHEITSHTLIRELTQPRPGRAIVRSGAKTLGELSKMTHRRLRSIPSVGPTTIDELILALGAAGLSLSDTEASPEQIGDRIKELREAAFWTINDVAKQMDVHYSRPSSWESGAKCPNDAQLAKLAEIFETTIRELTDPTGSDETPALAGAEVAS